MLIAEWPIAMIFPLVCLAARVVINFAISISLSWLKLGELLMDTSANTPAAEACDL